MPFSGVRIVSQLFPHTELFSNFARISLHRNHFNMSEDTFDKDEKEMANLPEKEEHSDYKPVSTTDEAVKHQLSGMYQNWFLD